MPSVSFAGYYGMSNYGDDLFGVAAVLGCKHYWRTLRPRIVGPRIKGFPSRNGVGRFMPARAYQGSGRTGQGLRAVAFATGAMSSHKFVFAGGSIFHSGHFGVNELACAVRRGDCSAIGVSVGPFPNQKSEIRIKEMLKRFEYIAVRDASSFEVVKEFGVEGKLVLAADIAGILPSFLHAGPRGATAVIGFSPCSTARNGREFCDSFLTFIRGIRREREISVCILNLNEHRDRGDALQCAYVAHALEREGISHSSVSYLEIGVEQTWHLIGTFAFYVTARLHGAVTSYLLDRPFALHEYHPKCTAFLDSIGVPLRERLDSSLDMSHVYNRGSLSTLRPGGYTEAAMKNFTEAPWAA